jgi:uncharacterized protein YegL
VYLSIITFDIEARELFPLTPLDQVQIPAITVPGGGATFLGAALQLLLERVDRDVIKSTETTKGDWRPLVFLMTDGSPSDTQNYKAAVPEMKRRNFGNVVACAAGPKAKESVLRELTDSVYLMDTLDSNSFFNFFKWVSASVASGSSSAGLSTSNVLPPPPDEITLSLQ